MDEVNEGEVSEVKRIDPSEATTVEEFDAAAKIRHDELRLGMLGDDRMYESAAELSGGMSADEIKEKIAELGDEDEKLAAYREATLGDRADDPRGDRLEGAKFEWEQAVETRAYYDMALDAKVD